MTAGGAKAETAVAEGATGSGDADALGDGEGGAEDSGRAGSSFLEFDDGGEEPMDGGTPGGFDEENEWDIRDFTDPRTQETYPIIDGRVLIAFKNPPQLPTVDFDYFDEELEWNDAYFQQLNFGEVSQNQEVAAFIQTEQLVVYSEWNSIRGLAALLPEITSVEYAVENWVDDYPDLIESVEPDALGTYCAWPQHSPNDDLFINMWNLNESGGSQWHIKIQDAWRNYFYGNSSHVIAVIDSGVQRKPYFTDLNVNMLSWGVNTGDRKGSSEWGDLKGSPWQWLLDKDAHHARELGHGTCVAGVIMAGINNDSNHNQADFADFCGISPQNKVLPVAMKSSANSYSQSAYFNALTMVGCIKRIYDPRKEFGASGMTIPHSNVKVANCSFGRYRTIPDPLETRHLNALTPYIVVVGAAGNDGLPKSVYPAAHQNTVSVGAYNQMGKRASWDYGVPYSSNHTAIDLAAPGFAIWTTDMHGFNAKNQPLGYSPNDRFNGEGTSASAAHVSAIAAMLCSRYPGLNPAQIKQRLIAKGRTLPEFTPVTTKALDAYETLR